MCFLQGRRKFEILKKFTAIDSRFKIIHNYTPIKLPKIPTSTKMHMILGVFEILHDKHKNIKTINPKGRVLVIKVVVNS